MSCTAITQKGDDLDDVAARHGTTAQEIARANGVQWTTPAVNEWVRKMGGAPTGEVDRQGRPWMAFAAGTEIALPCTSSTRCKSCEEHAGEIAVNAPADDSESSYLWLWLLLLFGV